MYTWTSTFSEDYHILITNITGVTTPANFLAEISKGRTFTGAGGTCELPVGSTEGDSRDLKYLLSLYLDVTR